MGGDAGAVTAYNLRYYSIWNFTLTFHVDLKLVGNYEYGLDTFYGRILTEASRVQYKHATVNANGSGFDSHSRK